MATDLLTRKASSKAEAYVRRKFIELCGRIKRVDLYGHLLTLVAVVSIYACLVGTFDWLVGASARTDVVVTRFVGWGIFLCTFAVALVQAVRCVYRQVNPYFVAQQLERTLPQANNGLVNWLDLHDDALPSAFRSTLAARAAEQMENADTERPVSGRKNWILLGTLGLPLLGLVGVLAVLGPPAFLNSMIRAFVPFYTPTPILRTRITLVQPADGNVEVNPSQAIRFAVQIEGRVPSVNRPDAPALFVRYGADDDLQSFAFHPEGSGLWATQVSPSQLRSGFTYKIAAGDDITPEYQVRVRPRAHVAHFEINYRHKPYRPVLKTTSTFPNKVATRPHINGPRGTEVTLTIRPSRPARSLTVEFASKSASRNLPAVRHGADPQAFSCDWTILEPGKFRVAYTAEDGENNADREWYDIGVYDDLAPRVALTHPGKNIELPLNGVLQLEGHASSEVGVKELTLHLRLAKDPSVRLSPIPYRHDKSFQRDDGRYPNVIEYVDLIVLNELKTDKGTTHHATPGTVVEYWLEAIDCTDYSKPPGNVGSSSVFKVTLTATQIDAKTQTALRNAAVNKQRDHHKRQDNQSSQPSSGKKTSERNPPGKQDLQKDIDKVKKDTDATQKKLDDAAKQDKDNKGKGESKSSQPQNGESKPGPDQSSDGKGAQKKDQESKAPNDAGSNKDDGGGMGSSGQSKDSGEKAPSPKADGLKGERKDGPKDAPSNAKDDGQNGKSGPTGNAKDSGPMGMNEPPMQQAKNNPGGSESAPKPTNKQGSPEDPIAKNPPPQGNAKGIEQDGPELPNKDAQAAKDDAPPSGHAKASKLGDGNSPGESKQGPGEQGNPPSQARGDDSQGSSTGPTWDEMLDLLDRVPQRDLVGKAAVAKLADIAANADEDSRKRDIAREILYKNGFAPNGVKEEKKGPNPFGSAGKSPGVGDDVKATIAKREFAARIGQMQLDDWQKRVTPGFLKKAGLSAADWARFVENMKQYDALARQLNALQLRNALRTEMRGGKSVGSGARDIDSPDASTDPFGAAQGATPPELRDALRRFTTPRLNP